MANYIREQALEFGFLDENVKLSEYEILLHEPSSMKVGIIKNSTNEVFDLTASFLATNKTNSKPQVACNLNVISLNFDKVNS